MKLYMKLYKILNEEENHHGLQYHDGLNIDPVEFYPYGSCAPGGMYYTDQVDVLSFLSYGHWLREITLCSDSKVYKDPSAYEKKWKTNKFILGKRTRITGDIVQKLIDEGANVNISNEEPLRWASGKQKIAILKVLLKNGADVSIFDDLCLKYAAINNHLEVAKILLKAGANVNALNGLPLQEASTNNHLEMVNFLLESGVASQIGKDIAFLRACYNLNFPIIKTLLENGANIHVYDDLVVRDVRLSRYPDLMNFLKQYLVK